MLEKICWPNRSGRKNLNFFISLRNKIEHRHIEKREVDTYIFGECQALLFNYESFLIKTFGPNFALNEALVYSLQFSHLRTSKQKESNKSALSKDLSEIVKYVEKYRSSLDETVCNSQEYSIKLIQIPKISNTNRADAAIEFVKWNELNEEDRSAYEQIAALIKDRRVEVTAANVKRFKPSAVVKQVNRIIGRNLLTQNLHTILYKLFNVRPPNGSDDPFETNTEFCLFDETHNDYVFESAWVEFLVHFIQTGVYSPEQLRAKEKVGELLGIDNYRA